MTRVAVLGLGAMGTRMAQRLLASGFEVTVYNRSPARGDDLVAAGATRAASPREAAAGAEIVLSMVSDDPASRAVWASPGDGALAGLAAGAVAIETSTVSPAWITEFAALVTARNAYCLAAPVVGSRPQADTGALQFLVGGDAALLERVRPLLSAMGAAVHHVGRTDHAAILKLAANTLFAVQVAALGEIIALLASAGVDLSNAQQILGQLPVMSPAAKGAAVLIAQGQHAPLFPIDLVAKDLRYFLALSPAGGRAAPLATCTAARYADAIAAGFGACNITAVAQLR
jgi:3-hydroxyisobutyrate dehydrogenase